MTEASLWLMRNGKIDERLGYPARTPEQELNAHYHMISVFISHILSDAGVHVRVGYDHGPKRCALAN